MCFLFLTDIRDRWIIGLLYCTIVDRVIAIGSTKLSPNSVRTLSPMAYLPSRNGRVTIAEKDTSLVCNWRSLHVRYGSVLFRRCYIHLAAFWFRFGNLSNACYNVIPDATEFPFPDMQCRKEQIYYVLKNARTIFSPYILPYLLLTISYIIVWETSHIETFERCDITIYVSTWCLLHYYE